jgi:hypothetical protein
MDQRFQRNVERVCALGPRPVGEMLEELGRRYLIRTAIDEVVQAYAALDPAIVSLVGGDRFAPRPLLVVPET